MDPTYLPKMEIDGQWKLTQTVQGYLWSCATTLLPYNSSFAHQDPPQMPTGATSAILQAAHHLGSVASPTTTATVTHCHHAQQPRWQSGSSPPLIPSAPNPGRKTAPPATHGSQHPIPPLGPSSVGAMNQQYESPRRSRNPDELHMSGALGASSQRTQPRDYTPGAPRISLEQATPEGAHFQNSSQLPGSLQPGRPGSMSINTAPSVPQSPLAMSQEPVTTPSRSTMSMSHNYTRSSPAVGFEGHGYSPFSSTTPGTEQGNFTSPTNQKYVPTTVKRNVSNTPLGLADIRPRTDSLMDGSYGVNPYSYDGANATPTNSNYLAPWALYSFDWCKWPAHNHDAGKVAIGSYLEDGHNFVSS